MLKRIHTADELPPIDSVERDRKYLLLQDGCYPEIVTRLMPGDMPQGEIAPGREFEGNDTHPTRNPLIVDWSKDMIFWLPSTDGEFAFVFATTQPRKSETAAMLQQAEKHRDSLIASGWTRADFARAIAGDPEEVISADVAAREEQREAGMRVNVLAEVDHPPSGDPVVLSEKLLGKTDPVLSFPSCEPQNPFVTARGQKTGDVNAMSADEYIEHSDPPRARPRATPPEGVPTKLDTEVLLTDFEMPQRTQLVRIKAEANGLGLYFDGYGNNLASPGGCPIVVIELPIGSDGTPVVSIYPRIEDPTPVTMTLRGARETHRDRKFVARHAEHCTRCGARGKLVPGDPIFVFNNDARVKLSSYRCVGCGTEFWV